MRIEPTPERFFLYNFGWAELPDRGYNKIENLSQEWRESKKMREQLEICSKVQFVKFLLNFEIGGELF